MDEKINDLIREFLYKNLSCKVEKGYLIFEIKSSDDSWDYSNEEICKISISEILKGIECAEKLFVPEVRGHSKDFWGSLQALHDNAEFWDENGLSIEGHAYVEELKEKWEN